MLPHRATLLIQIIAGGEGVAGVLLQKGGVIPTGDKADVLAVVLAGIDKAVLLGNLPHLLLGQRAQRELNVGKLLLAETGEKIGLVFGGVCGAL